MGTLVHTLLTGLWVWVGNKEANGCKVRGGEAEVPIPFPFLSVLPSDECLLFVQALGQCHPLLSPSPLQGIRSPGCIHGALGLPRGVSVTVVWGSGAHSSPPCKAGSDLRVSDEQEKQ